MRARTGNNLKSNRLQSALSAATSSIRAVNSVGSSEETNSERSFDPEVLRLSFVMLSAFVILNLLAQIELLYGEERGSEVDFCVLKKLTRAIRRTRRVGEKKRRLVNYLSRNLNYLLATEYPISKDRSSQASEAIYLTLRMW